MRHALWGLGLATVLAACTIHAPDGPVAGKTAGDRAGNGSTLAETAKTAVIEVATNPTLKVRDFIGRVEILPSADGQVRASLTQANGLGPFSLKIDGQMVKVESEKTWNWNLGGTQCSINNGQLTLKVHGRTYSMEDLPLLSITAPASLNADISGMVMVKSADLAELSLSNAGCLDSQIGNVAGQAQVEVAGSGKVSLGNVGGQLGVELAGSGEVTAGNVANGLAAELAGSGTVNVADLQGALSVETAGAGLVNVAKGRAQPFKVDIAGASSVDFGGTAVDVDVSMAGAGSVRVAAAEGTRSVESVGAGSFSVRP